MASPEQKLKRYLHFGSEEPFYQPGDRTKEGVYQPGELHSIEALIASEKFGDASNCIVKAYSDGYTCYPETLVYALAVCARQKTCQQLREAAYNAVKTVCASQENLFLFIKYCTRLASPYSGWGSGSRRVIKEWYLKKDIKQLATAVSKNKSLHGWTHKDVLNMIHVKTDEPARAAIFKYAMFGIKAAKTDYGEVAEAQEVLNYLQTVEDVRHATDKLQVVSAIEKYKLTLEHVPSTMLKCKEVWAAVIPNLHLHTIINSLQRIGYLGLLKPQAPLVNVVIDMLNNETAIAESHLHPARVFVALRNYEMSAKFIAAETAQKKLQAENGGATGEGGTSTGTGTSGAAAGSGSGESKKAVKAPPKPNPKIITAMYVLYNSTCKLFLPATGMRYLVAIDVKSLNLTDKCFRSPHVSPAQAAVLTTLCLLQADRDVTVVQSGQQGEVVPLLLESSMSVQQGVEKLKETHTQRRMMTPAPIEYCLQKQKQVDVFVIISDGLLKTSNQVVSAFNKYRQEMKLPNTKLIMNLVKTHREIKLASDTGDTGLLDIGGFDGNVPKIIEAFSRGAF